MPEIVDPTAAMLSFREAVSNGYIKLRQGRIHPEIGFTIDSEHGMTRWSYASFDRKTLTGLAILFQADDNEGLPCFQIGVAVPMELQGLGFGKKIVAKAIDEFKSGMFGAGIGDFYLEAVVAADNHASNKVVIAEITSHRTIIEERLSGKRAYHYILRVERPAE